MPTPSDPGDSGYAIGIDLGGTKTLGVVLSATGQVLHEQQVATRRYLGPDEILDDVAALVHDLEGRAGGAEQCRGVGLGVAALVTPARTVIDSTILPAWHDVDVGATLAARIGHSVAVDNDTTMALLSEIWQSPVSAEATVLCLTLGTGVGAAVMRGTEVMRGPDGTAGQLGHMGIEVDGRPCECGSRGCLNAYASGTAIASRFAEADASHPVSHGREVWELARDGNAAALAVIASTAHYLGAALASLANIFDPELIVIGGGVASIGDPLLGPATEVMRNRALARPGRRARVVAAAHGARAGAVGAAVAGGEAAQWRPVPQPGGAG